MDPAPADGFIPRTMSMTWGLPCDVEASWFLSCAGVRPNGAESCLFFLQWPSPQWRKGGRYSRLRLNAFSPRLSLLCMKNPDPNSILWCCGRGCKKLRNPEGDSIRVEEDTFICTRLCSVLPLSTTLPSSSPPSDFPAEDDRLQL